MHERLRTHAESVAFFGGGAREKEVVIFFLQQYFFQQWDLSEIRYIGVFV